MSEVIEHLPASTELGVQAIEKPKNPAKFDKICHRITGVADGQIYSLRLQPKPMVVINFQDQLQAGTFEHALHYLVTEKLGLSIFDKAFKNDHEGRSAYDPAILLKIILFAYSKGITSSREIQWCCVNNIIFKALSCDSMPHYTIIASFVSGYPEQIETLFEQILLICDEQGLLGHELFAIEGCKLPSDAAKTWSGTHKELSHKRDKLEKC